MSLLDWIDIEKLNWDGLSYNPAAVSLLEQNLEKINWKNLSCNPAAIHLLEKNQDKIHWDILSRNPAAIHLLEQNQDKIEWDYLSQNPEAIRLLEQNPDKMNRYKLSQNPAAIHFLEKNPDKIDWSGLSQNKKVGSLLINKIIEAQNNGDNASYIYYICKNPNPYVIHFLEKKINIVSPNAISWYDLSKNPAAITLLKQYPDKINWRGLSQNPAALPLMKQYPDKIDWESVFHNTNPQVFDFLLEETQMPDMGFYSFFCHICHIPLKHISLFEKNQNKYYNRINSNVISQNPAAIRVIEQCIDTVDWKEPRNIIKWDFLSKNPAIFKTEEHFVLK